MAKSVYSLAVAFALLSIAFSSPAMGQTGDFKNPCELSPITDFDFWVGEWVAFDFKTGIVQGLDRIEKVNNSCTLHQEWTQMTDRYRLPGAPYRYAGISFSSVLPNGKWQQTWIGNGGGTIVLSGDLNDAGTMVFESPQATAGNGTIFKRKWYWDPQDDGTIHSWGEVYTKNPDGSWAEPTLPWNLRYIPRSSAPDLVAKVE